MEWSVYTENIYKPTRYYFKSTKVDVRKRIVYEYDHKPAASVMAAALGVKVSELPKYSDSYPLGRIIGNEMFIVANNQVVNGSGMEYHARIYNNSQMVLLSLMIIKRFFKKHLTRPGVRNAAAPVWH